VETPDHWLRYGNPWEIERPEYIYLVKFYGRTISKPGAAGKQSVQWVDTEDIIAMAYDTPVPGYRNNTVNNLRLWAAKSTRDFNLEFFNSGDYDSAVHEKISSETLSKVLYPRDDIIQGRVLRLKQEYFLVSATLQDIVRRFKKTNSDFAKFPDKVSIQLNDTHPSLAIAELMYILVDKENLGWDEAWDITVKTFNYTNHTVMPEALEKWKVTLLQQVLPRHLQIIFEINHRFLQQVRSKFPNDIARLRRASIIEESAEKYVRMANLSIIGSSSVNGVAALHTEIIKNDLFRDFYELWPNKFNNKTNGITQRRWLLLCNPALADCINRKIGDKWITNLNELKNLQVYARDKDFQKEWLQAKQQNKESMADFIFDKVAVKVDPKSIFDVQIKRIHEYKRQLLNLLHVVTLYNRIKKGQKYDHPSRTVIFAGKAAPSYVKAKIIIKMINMLADTINNDPDIGDRLKIIFLPDYSVSLAEKIIPAADLSEQISTAGMEASGTGNMKFALNGALTIGTLDGANIEIMEQVGKANIFIFGNTAEQVRQRHNSDYNPYAIYQQNNELKQVIDLLASAAFADEHLDLFKNILDGLLHNDNYMLFADYQSYIDTQTVVAETFKNPAKWAEMSIINCANMGMFSSDRTIMQYNKDIWRAAKVPITLGFTENNKKSDK
jgi:starch phosphorylase